jgi:hypothetical protein
MRSDALRAREVLPAEVLMSSCSFSRFVVPLCWVCGYAAATRYSPRGGSRRSERSEFCNDICEGG